MEELFSSTFDLDPACAPYVGHHLCGEGPRRGVFLARLADVYRQDGFEDRAGPAGELADHVSVVLRYLSEVPAGPGRKALLEDGLVPALDKMLAAPLDPDNVYRSVLAALREEVA
jgi:nitrate reductase delta subunit